MSLFSRFKSLFSSRPRPSTEQVEAIVDHLIQLGFLKFVAESRKVELRSQLIESVTNHYLDTEWDDDCISADKRSYSADAEDLAEGDIGSCLRLMKGVLADEGVQLESIEDDFSGERYRVVINGVVHPIYDLSEHTQEDSWSRSHRRLVEIVNSLLQDAGSNERLFGIYGGNDGRVMLLTQEIHEFLRASGNIFDQSWIPVPASKMAS